MPRTIIDIPEPQLIEVDRLCKLLSISRAEAVRRGLERFVESNAAVTTDGFGLWKGASPAGAPTGAGSEKPGKPGKPKPAAAGRAKTRTAR